MTDKRTATGFIGLGLMGRPMSQRLRAAGCPLTVWNRTEGKATTVLEAGAILAESPAEVARASNVIFLCLTDTRAVEDVLFGRQGIIEGGPGKIVVDHSTISPKAAIAFATRLRDHHDIRFIDAPVTGGVVGATNGSLTIFAGGESLDVEAVRPVISHLSSKFLHMGANGAGQTTKMCNQVMVMTTFVTMAEMLKLAENGGADPTQIPEILADGFANSRVLQLFGERMARRDPEITGRLTIAQKDLDLIQAVGTETSTQLPMCSRATELVRLAIAKGLGDSDMTQFIRLYD